MRDNSRQGAADRLVSEMQSVHRKSILAIIKCAAESYLNSLPEHDPDWEITEIRDKADILL